jgi:transposase
MKRYREYNQHQQYLLPPSELELIAENDLVRVVDEIIESLELHELHQVFRGGGRPAYHPVMMLKVLVYAYAQGVYSSRKIANLLGRDIHFMWLSGRERPDFRSINRFRGQYLAEIMPKVMGEVSLLLLERGYIKGKDFFVDGTTLEADANKYKIVWRKNTERYKDRVKKRWQKETLTPAPTQTLQP